MENVKCGLIRGTGSAENIDLGWTPDVVILWNHTDGDIIYIGAPQFFLCAFTSGGTTEVKKNALLEGATSGATGRVLGVMLDTGTWAGGDAAGWIVFDKFTITGTFQGENAFVPGGTNDITLTAAPASPTVDVDTEVAGATSNAAVSPFVGSLGATARGFTIGSTISENAKLFVYVALRSGPGSAGQIIENSA